MITRRYFGTDGIRGRANSTPMTVDGAMRLGRAVSKVFRGGSHRPRILLGKDTRLSGYMLEAALVAGITSTGADVILLGPLPTPGIAFLTTSMRADASIVISASHNPYYDNGLKVFGSDGFKLDDEIEAKLEQIMDDDDLQDGAIDAAIGRARRIEDAYGRYITHIKRILKPEHTLEGLKLVVDCANGAAYKAAPDTFRELGAEVITLGTSPNGLNINDGVGSLHPEAAAKLVTETGADLGVALDGDADRVTLIDAEGNIIDGDHILGICAAHFKREGSLANDTVVGTSMTNLGLEHFLNDHGITLERTDVGDRYVVQKMRADDLNLGGEKSGHIIFLDHTNTGDGIAAAIQILNVMLDTDRSLASLAAEVKLLPQLLKNLKVSSKPPLEQMSGLQAAIRAAEEELGDNGRVVVRYSGTEDLIRIMVEANSDELVNRIADDIASSLGDITIET